MFNRYGKMLLIFICFACASCTPDLDTDGVAMLKPTKKIYNNISLDGTVSSFGPNTITLKSHENGSECCLRLSSDLRSGNRPTWPPDYDYRKTRVPYSDWERYKMSEVKIGDIVKVTGAKINQVDYCYTIWICERPGGLIPPAPDEEKTNEDRYHVIVNARLTNPALHTKLHLEKTIKMLESARNSCPRGYPVEKIDKNIVECKDELAKLKLPDK